MKELPLIKQWNELEDSVIYYEDFNVLGVFSIFTIIVFAISYVSNGYIFYALTYLELWPKWDCVGAEGDACNASYACTNPDKVSIDWTASTSLHNWVERFNL